MIHEVQRFLAFESIGHYASGQFSKYFFEEIIIFNEGILCNVIAQKRTQGILKEVFALEEIFCIWPSNDFSWFSPFWIMIPIFEGFCKVLLHVVAEQRALVWLMVARFQFNALYISSPSLYRWPDWFLFIYLSIYVFICLYAFVWRGTILSIQERQILVVKNRWKCWKYEKLLFVVMYSRNHLLKHS